LEDTNLESSTQQTVEEKIVSTESPTPAPSEPVTPGPQPKPIPKKKDPPSVKESSVAAVTKQPVAKAEPRAVAVAEKPPVIKPKAAAESKNKEQSSEELDQSNSRWGIGAFYGFKHLSL